MVMFQVVTIEDELSAIGENQKQLEVSEEKARRREEKYQVAILNIFEKGRKKEPDRILLVTTLTLTSTLTSSA